MNEKTTRVYSIEEQDRQLKLRQKRTELGDALSDFLEGQLTEEEDMRLRQLTPEMLFEVLQKTGYIAKGDD